MFPAMIRITSRRRPPSDEPRLPDAPCEIRGFFARAGCATPPRVTAVRRLLAQRHLAVLLCVATLLLKLLVPTGYMIGGAHGQVTIELCSGIAPQPVAMVAPAMHGSMPGHGTPRDHGKAQSPCAFAGISAASLGAVDTVQLAALIAFVMAAALAPVVLPAIVRRSFLWPPLRGPPIRL